MTKHEIPKSWLAMPLVGLVAGIPLGYLYAMPASTDAASQNYKILPGVVPAGGSGPIYLCQWWHSAGNPITQWGIDLKQASNCIEAVGTGGYTVDVVGSGSKPVYGATVKYTSNSGCTGIGLALYTSSSYSSSSYLGTLQYVHINPTVGLNDTTTFNPMATSYKAGIGTVLGQETALCQTSQAWSGPHLHQAYSTADGVLQRNTGLSQNVPAAITFNDSSQWAIMGSWTTPK